MRLISALRSGENRFLPLLLAKVNDVLPTLVNPMLKTVPDPPANAIPCHDVDIFDGFGSGGMGIPGNFPGYNGNGTSGEFKMEPNDFNVNPVPSMPSYDRRIEELSSPSVTVPSENVASPYSQESIIHSPLEYPGMNEFRGFPELSSPGLGSNVPAHQHPFDSSHSRPEFKREFDSNMGLASHRPPLRQSSTGNSSNYGMSIPRSIPPMTSSQYQHLQRVNSGGESVGEMPFR
jgi:hypothetical protein